MASEQPPSGDPWEADTRPGRLQRQVSFVTRAMRALSHALLRAFAKDVTLYGAERDELRRTLQEEFGTADEARLNAHWERFEQLVCRRFGPRALKGKALVIFQPYPREVSDRRRSLLPDIFPVVRDLFQDRLPFEARQHGDAATPHDVNSKHAEGPSPDPPPQVPPGIPHELFRDRLPRPMLHDLYRQDLLRRFRMRDTPRFIAFALEWMEAFNCLVCRTVTRQELLHLVPTRPGRVELWVCGLIEVLGYVSTLRCRYWFERNRPEEPKVYLIHQKADPLLVLSSLFGKSTGVPGLDYLLYGGLWVPGGQRGAENLALAISGGPGLGKSTLALALAAQVAARGGVTLYLHFQLDSRTIRRQLTQFQRRLLPFFHVERVAAQGRPVPADPDRGLFLIAPLPTAPHEKIQDELLRLVDVIREVAERRGVGFAERLVVFDSISACEGYGTPPGIWREFLDRLAQHLRPRGFNTVFLVEREGGLGDGFENYLVDVDLRLGSRVEDGYLFRTLRVAKSRWQASHRGEHYYTIRPEGGLQVFPSSAAVVSVEWKREPHIRRRSEGEPVDPGVAGFSHFLGCKEGMADQSVANAWWSKGSTTALLGSRGMLKTTFGTLFCEHVPTEQLPPDDLGEHPSALFLHFSAETHDGQRPTFTWANARPSATGARYDVPLPNLPECSARVPARVVHVFFRSGFLAPGQVFQVVRDLIAESRQAASPIRRAVIADAGNIVPDFPTLKNDPAFIPALCGILSSEAITTLLIYSYPEHGGTDYVVDQVRSTSQNIIRCEPIQHGGVQSVAVFVERSFNGMHSRGTYELVKTEDAHHPLRVLNSLDLVLDPLSEAPRTAEIKLMLHSETELQRLYHANIRALHSGLSAYQVQIVGHPAGLAHYKVAQEVIARERALWITQIDAYAYVDLVSPRNGAKSTLLNLAQVDPRVKDLRDGLIMAPRQGQRKDGRGEVVLSLPFYLNPSFLAVNADLLAFLRERLPNGGMWEAPGGRYTWGDLIQGVGSYLEHRGQVERPSHSETSDAALAFDCPLETQENLNCLFLEILASCIGGAEALNGLNFFTCFGPASPWNQDAQGVLVDAARQLRRAFKRSFDQHQKWSFGKESEVPIHRARESREKEKEYLELRIDPGALVQRHWYSTFREMARVASGGLVWRNPGFEVMRLPGGVWTCGDWHLGILEGSVGVRSGVSILLEEFLAPEAAMQRLVQGVGLPPHRSFYEGDDKTSGKMPVLQVSPSWFKDYVDDLGCVIRRSKILGYQQIAPVLHAHLCAILSHPEVDETWLRGQFLTLHTILAMMPRPKR